MSDGSIDFMDIGNIQLTFFGVALTLFTLIYSFIISKREELEIKSNKVSEGNNSPSLIQKISFLKSNIKRMKFVNQNLLIIIFTTFSLFITSYLFTEINLSDEEKKYSLIGLKIILVIEIIFVLYVFFRIYEYYKSSIKI